MDTAIAFAAAGLQACGVHPSFAPLIAQAITKEASLYNVTFALRYEAPEAALCIIRLFNLGVGI